MEQHGVFCAPHHSPIRFYQSTTIRSMKKGVAKVERSDSRMDWHHQLLCDSIDSTGKVLNAPEENETAEHILSLYDHYIRRLNP